MMRQKSLVMMRQKTDGLVMMRQKDRSVLVMMRQKTVVFSDETEVFSDDETEDRSF